MAMKAALMVIDMLNDFVIPIGALYVEGSEKLVEPIKDLASVIKPVIFACDAHNYPDPEFDTFPPHCIAGTSGALIIKDLRPTECDKNVAIIPKHNFSATTNPKLDEFFFKNGIDTLFVTGVATEYCVYNTIFSLIQISRIKMIFLITDCVTGIDPEAIQKALKDLRSRGVFMVDSSTAKLIYRQALS
jgi:nicotinamidase/pyrazinamidase